MFTVTISEKGGQQSRYEFNKPEITIGRMKGNDIVLPKGNVSKKHTRIFVRDGGFAILDLESTNGTYVNGRKVTNEQFITETDKIYIGDFILQLERSLAASAGGAPTPPPQPPRAPGGYPTRPPHPTINQGAAGPPQPPAQPAADLATADAPGRAPMHTPTPPPQDAAAAAASPLADADQGEADWNLNHTPTPDPIRSTFAGGPIDMEMEEPAPATPELEPEDLSSTGPSDIAQPPELAPVTPSPYAGGGALITAPELVDEFDEEFHLAQHEVARVLFESITPEDLPEFYPPEPTDRDAFEEHVRTAIEAVNPSVDHDALAELMIAECIGLGPIDQYLDSQEIQDIYVNRYDRILVRKNGKLTVAPFAFSQPEFLTIAAYRLLGTRDVVGGIDQVRFSDGTRVHIVLPPVAVDGPVMTIRKPVTAAATLEDLVVAEVLSHGMCEFLGRAVEAGRSILVAGPTSSGKTTLLSALANAIPSGSRIITVEESSQLRLPQQSVVRLEANTSAGISLRDVLRNATAMHPQRILLDECRGAEAYEWVTSAASGTDGSMITVHGTSAPDALGRMESLSLLGSGDMSPRGLREQIARAVNLVVVVNRTPDGAFRVQQITEVQGVDLDAFRLNDVFYYRVEGNEGAFHPTGYIPLFYEDLRHAGFDVDFGIFRE